MNNKISIITSLILLIFLTICVKFKMRFLLNLDKIISFNLYNMSSNLTPLIKRITQIANPSTITIIVVIISIILLINKLYSYSLFFIFNIVSINIIYTILKITILRIRPNLHHLVIAKGYSFPSGHSASSMAICLSLILILNLAFKHKLQLVKIIVFIIPFIVAFSRIYLGVHYFSDVLAGLLLGLFMTQLNYHIFIKKDLAKNS